MANQEQLKILKQGVEVWNKWRKANPLKPIDLSNEHFNGINLEGIILNEANLCKTNLSCANLFDANLSKANLTKANLSCANLFDADLSDANLFDADLTNAQLPDADLKNANLKQANLSEANLNLAHLSHAILTESILTNADLNDAVLSHADLTQADLRGANLFQSDLSNTILCGAKLKGANLTNSICIETDFCDANIENTNVYGISVWNIKTERAKQENLIITKEGEPTVTVDNLEVAQFIYLLLNNEKIRDVIGTIAKKGVLILGRFTPDRKKVLDAIRDKLRDSNFAPMMFDFEKVSSRDFTETIKILAGMSRFVIADITNPSSSPLELQAIIPDYKIPFLPIIKTGEKPFAMFSDLTIYPWCLDLISYDSESDLMRNFQKGIIDPAIEKEKLLMDDKAKDKKPPKNIKDV